jgi:uncharacterized protein
MALSSLYPRRLTPGHCVSSLKARDSEEGLQTLLRHTDIWHICHMPSEPTFEWDRTKDRINRVKHGVAFASAQMAFFDPRRVIAKDLEHSDDEPRYFCFGKVGLGIMTVRFTYRERRIRIFGAGYWRKGKRIYEQQNR